MDREALVDIKTAILNNNAELLEILLSSVFSYNKQIWQADNDNEEYLSLMEFLTSKELVEFLQNHSSDNVNIKNYPYSHCLLAYVCSFASVDVAQMLIDLGANFKSKDDYGHVSIKIAFQSGRKDLIDLLLDENVVVSEDINDLCLLHHYISSQTAEEELIRELLELGADVRRCNDARKTVLNCAIETGNLKLVKFLVTKAGADVNGLDVNGDSELTFAVARGEEEICKYLLESGADVNLGTKWSPLAKACKTGDLEVAKLLVSYGADVDGGYDYCGSPIAKASFFEHEKLIEYLLEQGAERDDRALFYAIVWRNLKMVKFLMEQGFGASGETASHITALSCAIVNGTFNRATVKFILDSGARIDEKTIDGKFPIHYAAEAGGIDIFQLLLDYGAEINAECDGKTPLMISVERKHSRLTMFLVQQMALVKSQGLHVSEVNLNIAKTKVSSFYDECVGELKLLKSKKFDDSYLSYLDVYLIKDVDKLAALAENTIIRKTIKSNFKRKFPVYGKSIVKHFYKAVLRSERFTLLRKFFNHLSTRETNKLPKLPFIVLRSLVTYFSNKDIDVLNNIADRHF